MRLFLDSSALAKRYIAESGTDLVISRCQEAGEIILSFLSIPEVISAFNRLIRERKLTSHHYRTFKRELARDVDEATMIDLSPPVIQETIACLEKCRVRTLDAIHLASARFSKAELFLSADQRQLKAAKRLGIIAEFAG